MSEAPPERQSLLHGHTDAPEVYPVIQMIRRDVIEYIDTPLSYDALSLPDVTYTVIRPLEEKYAVLQHRGNLAVVFCFLVNRAYFRRDRSLATSSLSRTRAALCELLATRLLKEHAHDLMELALVLTSSWPIFSGAPPQLLDRIHQEWEEIPDRLGNAIEIAIISQSKRFIKSSACQKVIDAIWSGKIVYQAESSRSILSDRYKRTPIHFYDPHKAPLLDHYRLKVPAIRSVLEYTNFLLLFILFVLALEFSEPYHLNVFEGVFMVYALGFALEKVAAMQEHGIKVYFKGVWNGFDVAFITLYCAYAVTRIYGVSKQVRYVSDAGIDILALIAVLMFPRLAFVTLRNNIMVLSLRAMLIQFVVLMCIAVFCFAGFFYGLWTLSRNNAGYTAGTIGWWMLDLWFGLDASGFDNATDFHPFFGPMMMITYACLSNTLLLTVLVSILSHTFSTISEDAQAEAMFRRAVSTIEGVKADFLFSYQPPINLFALCIMLPLSYILNPRWYHKVNVFMIRATSFPILLFIALYERQAMRTGSITFGETVHAAAEKVVDILPKPLRHITWFEGLMTGPHWDIDRVFELEEELEEDSAIDIRSESDENVPAVPTMDPYARRRRQSLLSKKRQFSDSSTRSQQQQYDQQQQLQQPSRPPSPTKGPIQRVPSRQRLFSLLPTDLGSPAMVSPLRQALAPFPDLHGEAQEIPHATGDGHKEGPAVSYGPATRRRRLSSLAQAQQARGLPTGDGVSSTAVAQRGPSLTGGPNGQKGLGPQPHPVSEAAEEDGYRGSPEPMQSKRIENEDRVLVFQRLHNVEERQRRIEEGQQRTEELLKRLLSKFERHKDV